MIFFKRLIKAFLSKIIGHRFHLILGDTLVLDRYFWLLKHLPKTNEKMTLLDVGCGTGAFTLAAASRGYDSVGLSWDERNQAEAESSAKLAGLESRASFEIADIRDLHLYKKHKGAFDVCINFENMEHIIDDKKLMIDIFNALKPGGMLIFSSPYYFLRPISKSDKGPFSNVEDGGHVRRGYTKSMLKELCVVSGFQIDKISGCSGLLSQKITALYRVFFKINPLLAWIVILSLRILPLLFDKTIAHFFGTIDFSICMVAVKPRFHS